MRGPASFKKTRRLANGVPSNIGQAGVIRAGSNAPDTC